jgi:hypothetical protein
MAIDRDGTAWLGFDDGAIFKVSTDTLQCLPSGYETAQLNWTKFGMAFVGGRFDQAEVLYLADGEPLIDATSSSRGLARVDPSTLRLEIIGPLSGLQERACELTGLETDVLHVFCSGTPSTLAVVKPDDSRVLSTTNLPLGKVRSFAIAQWSGSDYVFSSAYSGSPSRVDRYVAGHGTKRVVQRSEYEIVGAGVSTCAPVTPD